MTKQTKALQEALKYLERFQYAADLQEEIKAALQEEPKPDYWHVVDEDGNSIYSASFKEACQDHINDALLYNDWYSTSVASKWVVRPLWNKPPVRQESEPLIDNEILQLWAGSDTIRPILGAKKGLRFAREIERKVRGEK